MPHALRLATRLHHPDPDSCVEAIPDPPRSEPVRKFTEVDGNGRLTDTTLAHLARAGDRHAFAELVVRHELRVRRLVLRIVRDPALADDASQEVWIRVYRGLEHFDGRSELYTWMYRIAVNVSLNAIRSRKLKAAMPESVDAVEPAQDPREQALQAERCRSVERALSDLTETLRVPLLLSTVDGIPHEEIATILGISEGTVAWRIHEARKKLREYLARLDSVRAPLQSGVFERT